MSLFYGVYCKNPSCNQFISLGNQRKGASFAYEIPEEEIPCTHCSTSHKYTHLDVADELGNSLAERMA
jgi:hypothetical protein